MIVTTIGTRRIGIPGSDLKGPRFYTIGINWGPYSKAFIKRWTIRNLKEPTRRPKVEP